MRALQGTVPSSSLRVVQDHCPLRVVILGISGRFSFFGLRQLSQPFGLISLGSSQCIRGSWRRGARDGEVNRGHIVSDSNGALVEYITEHLSLLGCLPQLYMSFLAVDITLLEPGGGRSENEIGRTFDIALVEIEPAVLPSGIDGVLIAQ